jgi:hypothetical protein
MTNYPYILFNKSPLQLCLLGNSSGGLSCFQERRNWLRLAI